MSVETCSLLNVACDVLLYPILEYAVGLVEQFPGESVIGVS
jgi:hypothetical protein